MSSLIKVKDAEQRKALNNWVKSNYNGSIIAGTGFGKSRCGVLAVNFTFQRRADMEGAKALVLVPTQQLQDQFKDEFIKWGFEHLLESIEVMCCHLSIVSSLRTILMTNYYA